MPMVEIHWPDGKGSYFIDAYEVKGKEYAVFEGVVQGGYVPPVTDKSCEANKTYIREAECIDHWGGVTEEQIAEAGVYCVNYCHARAYCEWVGKRMCNLSVVKQPDGGRGIEKDEWANACSNGGQSPSSSELPQKQCDFFDPPCPDVVPGLYGMEWGFGELVHFLDLTGTTDSGWAGAHDSEGDTPAGTISECYRRWTSLSKMDCLYYTTFRCCR